VLVEGNQVWSEPRAISVVSSTFFERSMLMVRKLLLKNDQAFSTDGMRSISFQDSRARSMRKACSQKCFRERLTVMRGGHLTADL
jgi:nicotinamide riboside kinase